jgi:hypothetical protein
MSSTTRYLALAAAALVGLWLVNAAFYRRSHGTFWPKAAERQTDGSGRLGTHHVVAAIVLVGMLLFAFAIPYVMPGSAFAVWLAEPYAILVYCVWAWVLATSLYVVTRLVLRKRYQRTGAVSESKL